MHGPTAMPVLQHGQLAARSAAGFPASVEVHLLKSRKPSAKNESSDERCVHHGCFTRHHLTKINGDRVDSRPAPRDHVPTRADARQAVEGPVARGAG